MNDQQSVVRNLHRFIVGDVPLTHLDRRVDGPIVDLERQHAFEALVHLRRYAFFIGIPLLLRKKREGDEEREKRGSYGHFFSPHGCSM